MLGSPQMTFEKNPGLSSCLPVPTTVLGDVTTLIILFMFAKEELREWSHLSPAVARYRSRLPFHVLFWVVQVKGTVGFTHVLSILHIVVTQIDSNYVLRNLPDFKY